MKTAADTHIYTLKFSGTPDDDFLASFCPARTELIVEPDTFTLTNLRADQAGLLGIIRSLHNLGCALLSLSTIEAESK